MEHLLRKDVVEVIAPSSLSSSGPEHLKEIAAFLDEVGLVARLPKDLLDPEFNIPYLANRDEVRLKQLKQAILDENSKIIWAIQGGYGSARLVDSLLDMPKPPFSKIFIGFSDITCLHIFFGKYWGWKTLHAKSLRQFCKDKINKTSVDELLDIIFGRTKLLRYDNLTCLNIAAQTSDALEAKIVGGNLSIVQTSIGTDWQIDASDKILFLEDVSERGYRIDRMLNHLKQAGIMSNVKAVILGDFTDSKEKDGSDLVDLAIADFAAKVTFPVFRTPEIGHNAANRPLPLNTKARLTGGISPSLSVDMQEFWN